MQNHTIYGVHITDRVQEAVEVQRVLTAFGDVIKTRLGLHELDKGHDTPKGLLLLEMEGDQARFEQMRQHLSGIEGVDVQQMVFQHP